MEGTKVKVRLLPDNDKVKSTVTLTELLVKGRTDGRTWYIYGSNPKYGTELAQLADKLPTKIQVLYPDADDPEVQVQDFYLSTGQRLDGRRMVGGEAPIRHLLADGTNAIRACNVSISETKRGTWQFKVSINRGTSEESQVDREAERMRKLAEKTAAALE